MNTFTKIVLIYYLVINIILFSAMGIDKLRAKKDRWRIPEANLFVMSILGGGIGGICGMFAFHHKTKHIYFYIIYGISIILHIALLYLVFTKFI